MPVFEPQDGNRRFVDGRPLANRTNAVVRKELVELGQAPHTAIIGCADSRAPLETIFDTMPGTVAPVFLFRAFLYCLLCLGRASLVSASPR